MDVEPAYFKAGNKARQVRFGTYDRPGTWDMPGPTPTDWVERAMYLDVSIL